MWGLLLALAAFAPAVGPALGAPRNSVLDLAQPATTKVPGSIPATNSSLAQLPVETVNGEFPDRGSAPAQADCPASLPRRATLP